MIYKEEDVRRIVVEAGLRLVSEGLISRTWGNLSARISDTQFVITPSGRAYETLRPEDLVVVGIADCAYSGDVKPSSEKGIHADTYRLRPEVGFVIHTHQTAASAIGTAREPLCAFRGYDVPDSTLLGDTVPCAAYGLPGTKRLRAGVADALADCPDSHAVLMPYHGALCVGETYEETFRTAAALEAVSAKKIDATCGSAAVHPLRDCGESVRTGERFTIQCGDHECEYAVADKNLPEIPAIHAAIYRTGDVTRILHVTAPDVAAVSEQGRTLRPRLDDLAQIAGVSIRCAALASRPERIAALLRGRNAILLEGCGALCTGADADDARAAAEILTKACLAERYCSAIGVNHRLSAPDVLLQRTVYLRKYARQKSAAR
jgi:L-ribulose-5-phosphate 4-epimerase